MVITLFVLNWSYFQGAGADYGLLEDVMKSAVDIAKKILPAAKELGESAAPLIESLAKLGKPILEALSKVLLGEDADKGNKKPAKAVTEKSTEEIDSQYTDMDIKEVTKVNSKTTKKGLTSTTSKVKN